MLTACPTRIRLRWHWWVVFGAVGAVLLVVGLRRPIPQIVILPPQEPLLSPVQRLRDYAWYWCQFHAPGPRRSVRLQAQVFKLGLRPDQTDLSLPPPTASTNGVDAWLLSAEKLRTLRTTFDQLPGAEMICQPSIQTGRGIRGSMAAGLTIPVNGTPLWAGIELSSLATFRRGGVDLTSRVLFTEPITNAAQQVSVSTNLAVRTRTQIPSGGGMLVLGDHKEGKTFAVLLSATVQF